MLIPRGPYSFPPCQQLGCKLHHRPSATLPLFVFVKIPREVALPQVQTIELEVQRKSPGRMSNAEASPREFLARQVKAPRSSLFTFSKTSSDCLPPINVTTLFTLITLSSVWVVKELFHQTAKSPTVTSLSYWACPPLAQSLLNPVSTQSEPLALPPPGTGETFGKEVFQSKFAFIITMQ